MPEPWELNWDAPAAPPPAAAGARSPVEPWEMNWEQPEPPAGEDKSTLRRLAEAVTGGPPPGSTASDPNSWWPYRLGKQMFNAARSAATAPQDVLAGRLDPMSPEGIQRASEFAGLASPINPAARAGDFAIAGARAGRPMTPSMEAAMTAAEAGGELPAGLVGGPTMAKVTQAARSMPLVGSAIDERLAGTVRGVGERVGEMAEDRLGGIPPDRASVGASLRPSLHDAIDTNNGKISEAYTNLRDVIDPDRGVEMTATQAALDRIAKERGKAKLDPTAGLEDVARLVKEGGSDVPGRTGFDGIQRARSEVGNKINYAPNQGYNTGDLKRVYAALTADMGKAVRESVLPDVHPDMARAAFENANATAAKLIESNKKLHALTRMQSDERLVGSVINAAKDRGGDARLLLQLRHEMKGDFDQIAGIGLHELGQSPRTGQFSLETFGTNWRRLGNDAKSTLFPDPAHRARLDRFAKLDEFLKGSDRYLNKSQTAHSTLQGALIAEGAHAVTGLLTGDVTPALRLLGTLSGGALLGKALARPATAASIEKWTQALAAHNRRPSTATRAAVKIATTNLVSNLRSIPGFSEKEFNETLGGTNGTQR